MKISIIAPVLNEYECLDEFTNRVQRTIEKIDFAEIDLIFVDDGSDSEFLEQLKNKVNERENVKIISFDKNYGHQMALLAGYRYSENIYDACVSIDSDLQDPPELIQDLIKIYQEQKVNIVYTIRNKNDKRSRLKYLLSNIFYSLLFISNKKNALKFAGDFRLIDKKAINYINRNYKNIYFIRGFLFKNKELTYSMLNFQRDERFAGEPKYTFLKLYKLALSGLYPYINRYIAIVTFLLFISIFLNIYLKLQFFVYISFIIFCLLLFILYSKFQVIPSLNREYKIKKIY